MHVTCSSGQTSNPESRNPEFISQIFVLFMTDFLSFFYLGKTTFIKYLLERDFPGIHIGPEPTTDRFIAIMHGDQDGIVPGNALGWDHLVSFWRTSALQRMTICLVILQIFQPMTAQLDSSCGVSI